MILLFQINSLMGYERQCESAVEGFTTRIRKAFVYTVDSMNAPQYRLRRLPRCLGIAI